MMPLHDQTRAMAELDGWQREVIDSPLDPKKEIVLWHKGDRRLVPALPDYSTRDAVISVIEKQIQVAGFHDKFCRALMMVIQRDQKRFLDSGWLTFYMAVAEAAQLREALLRATGKWKES